MEKKVYASVWYHPMGKWKLDEAIVVEDGRITCRVIGGSFYYGGRRVKLEVLKEALLDHIFFDPEKYEDEEEWRKELEKLKKEFDVEFVDEEELKQLKKKYPGELSEEYDD